MSSTKNKTLREITGKFLSGVGKNIKKVAVDYVTAPYKLYRKVDDWAIKGATDSGKVTEEFLKETKGVGGTIGPKTYKRIHQKLKENGTIQ